MKKLLVVLVTLLFLAAVFAADVAYYYPRMPETMAVHFGPSGDGDQWQSKADFVPPSVMAVGIILSVFTGVCLLAGAGARFLPAAFRLPNKEYWLAPERRANTAARFAAHLLLFPVALLTFFLGMMHSTFVANLSAAPKTSNAIGVFLVVGLLAFLVGWIILFFVSFRLPHDSHFGKRPLRRRGHVRDREGLSP